MTDQDDENRITPAGFEVNGEETSKRVWDATFTGQVAIATCSLGPRELPSVTSISWKHGPRSSGQSVHGHVSRVSGMGQFESGSGIAIASALSVGLGLRDAEISE